MVKINPNSLPKVPSNPVSPEAVKKSFHNIKDRLPILSSSESKLKAEVSVGKEVPRIRNIVTSILNKT
jgi:hypothetical protein